MMVGVERGSSWCGVVVQLLEQRWTTTKRTFKCGFHVYSLWFPGK
jgi:hypothetical protein